MDNHPIPQDVTNFQFRLIGDMTIKQFAYLATGVGVGWLCIALPLFWIIKLPLAIVIASSGAFLAFVPFEGRPADVMVMHFFKALFTPNQYVYKKMDVMTPAAPATVQVSSMPTVAEPKETKEEKIVTVQSVTPVIPATKPQVEPEEVNQLQAYAKAKEQEALTTIVQPKPVQQVSPAPQVTQQTAQKQEQTLTQQTASLQSALTEAKKEEAKAQEGSANAERAHEKVDQLQNMLQDALLQKQQLEKQLLELQKSLQKTAPEKVFTPTTAAVPEKQEAKQTTHVRKIPKQLSKSVGLPITPDVPNLITGIVKDPRGNVLPNILIEVKDKDSNPVRAFKTNNLGQFASATPLLSGTYTVTFEDPAGKNSFDTVEMNVNGEILLPIEVISVDQREKLRQELFGA